MKSDIVRLGDIVLFNPHETMKKGKLAKKIDMSVLQPFTRDVPSFEILEYKGGTKFRNGDTIMARITPCLENGKTAKVNILEDDEVGFGSTEYIVFRAIDGITDADYVYYLVCSPIVREPAVKSMVGSSGRQRVQTDVLKNLKISIPDLKTQSRIAAVLSALDDKIELNNKINENLEQQLVCLYNAIFKNNTQYCELGSVVDTTSGGTPSRKKDEYYKNGSICWVKSKELTGTYLIDTEEKITEVGLSSSSAKIIPSNSTLIAMYGATVGEYGIISKPMTCNQAVCALIPNENFPFTVVFMFAMSNKNNLINLAIGSAQQNISQILIRQMKICCDLSLNKRFHGIAEPIFEKIKEIVVENARLSALRDTLLPKLMNGEIDVPEVKV